MKSHDVNQHLDWVKKECQENPKTINTFAGDPGVNDLLRKLKISHKLETKTHQFKDGPCEVAKKLTIEIDFDAIDFPVQPHSNFEGEACNELIDWAGNELNGLLENMEFNDDNGDYDD